VVLSLVPTKGITLPLISSGGTSLFFTLASIGILLNITKQVE
jgi:cell division protein FtsW